MRKTVLLGLFVACSAACRVGFPFDLERPDGGSSTGDASSPTEASVGMEASVGPDTSIETDVPRPPADGPPLDIVLRDGPPLPDIPTMPPNGFCAQPRPGGQMLVACDDFDMGPNVMGWSLQQTNCSAMPPNMMSPMCNSSLTMVGGSRASTYTIGIPQVTPPSRPTDFTAFIGLRSEAPPSTVAHLTATIQIPTFAMMPPPDSLTTLLSLVARSTIGEVAVLCTITASNSGVALGAYGPTGMLSSFPIPGVTLGTMQTLTLSYDHGRTPKCFAATGGGSAPTMILLPAVANGLNNITAYAGIGVRGGTPPVNVTYDNVVLGVTN